MIKDSSIKKILKKSGALRLSKNAIEKLKVLIEAYGLKIARRAVKNAEYSGRKSVKSEDLEEAMKLEELNAP
jgi:histone H3/H4